MIEQVLEGAYDADGTRGELGFMLVEQSAAGFGGNRPLPPEVLAQIQFAETVASVSQFIMWFGGGDLVIRQGRFGLYRKVQWLEGIYETVGYEEPGIRVSGTDQISQRVVGIIGR